MSAEPDDRSQPHDELVPVFDTKDDPEALVVRGLLESAGIEAIITSQEAPQGILPGVGGVSVLVSPERAAEARSLIEDYRNSAASGEDELNDDPAA